MTWVAEPDTDKFHFAGNTATLDHVDGSTPVNAMWKDGDGMSSGTHYYVYEFLGGSEGFVGVSTADNLKPGYAMKGAMYGGNLSDGGALLVGEFGPRFEKGDKVGMLLEFGDHLKIYFYHNGRCLGLAFDIPAPYPTGLYPSFHGSKKVIVSIEKSNDIPTERERIRPEMGPLEGEWKMSSITTPDGGAVEESDQWQPLACRTKGNESKLEIRVRVMNTVNVVASKHGDVWKAKLGPTTMMGGPPIAMRCERTITEFLAKLTKVDVADSQLKITSEAGLMKFEPDSESGPAPYRQNPLVRGH